MMHVTNRWLVNINTLPSQKKKKKNEGLVWRITNWNDVWTKTRRLLKDWHVHMSSIPWRATCEQCSHVTPMGGDVWTVPHVTTKFAWVATYATPFSLLLSFFSASPFFPYLFLSSLLRSSLLFSLAQLFPATTWLSGESISGGLSPSGIIGIYFIKENLFLWIYLFICLFKYYIFVSNLNWVPLSHIYIGLSTGQRPEKTWHGRPVNLRAAQATSKNSCAF